MILLQLVTMSSVEEIVRHEAKVLGYEKLRPQQVRVVESFVGGNDVFVSLPMGYGKSLCFGLLPRVFDTIRGVKKWSITKVTVSSIVTCIYSCQCDSYNNELATTSLCGIILLIVMESVSSS